MLFAALAVSVEAALLKTVDQLHTGEELKCTGGTMEKQEKSFRFSMAENERQCTVDVPLTLGDFKIYDRVELELATENPQAVAVFELFLASPPNTLLMKKDIKLKPGRHTYAYPIGGLGLVQPAGSARLTIYNGADNTHVAESKCEKPLDWLGLRFTASGKGLEKVPEFPDYNYLPEAQLSAAKARYDKFKTEWSKLKAEQKFSELYDLKNTMARQLEEQILAAMLNGRVAVYGSCDGVDKIYRQKAFPGRLMAPAEIAVARNEAEGAQIAVYAKRKLAKVSVSCGDLNDRRGNQLPASAISAAVIGYVKVPPPAYPAELDLLIPDPLLTYLKEFDVEPDCWQPVWIDVNVPKDQAPGEYRGEVTFLEDGRELFRVPLRVTVWNFTLPDKLSARRVFTNEFRFGRKANSFERLYAESQADADAAQAYMFSENPDRNGLSPSTLKLIERSDAAVDILRRHRIPSDSFYRSARYPIPGWQRRENQDVGAMFSLGYLNIDTELLLKVLAPQVEAMKKEGSLDLAYLYGYDEIRKQKDFDKMKATFGAVKKTFPELKLMATALDYTCGIRTGTSEEVDIWVQPTPNYMHSRNSQAVKDARARGVQVWWYPCNWPFPPTANYLLENTGVASRGLGGFMMWKFKADGILYYSTTAWVANIFSESLLRDLRLGKNGVRLLKLANYPVNRVYSLNSSDTMAELSAVETPKLEQVLPMRLTLESRVKHFIPGKNAVFQAVVTVNPAAYKKGRKRFVLPLDTANPEWQLHTLEFTPETPVSKLDFNIQLRSPGAEVEIRRIDLVTPNHSRRMRYSIQTPLRGGPVVEMENFPNMIRSSGDGSLVLPAENGVIPTIRLKFIRDGFEDYEYLTMLQHAYETVNSGRKNVKDREKWLKRAESALAVSDELCRNLNRYADRGAILLEHRREIAALLEQAN
jgi:hypothetical protein